MAKKKPKEEKIIDLSADIAVAFQALPGNKVGQSFVENNLIMIDLCKEHNVGETFLHELLHFKFPELDEAQVEKLACHLWAGYSQAERYSIYCKMFRDSRTYVDQRLP